MEFAEGRVGLYTLTVSRIFTRQVRKFEIISSLALCVIFFLYDMTSPFRPYLTFCIPHLSYSTVVKLLSFKWYDVESSIFWVHWFWGIEIQMACQP